MSGAAYFLTGLHPEGDTLADQLIALLEQSAQATGDEEERSAHKSSARSLRNVPAPVLASVLSAWVTHQTGIGCPLSA